jgi:hypothetical protein
VGATADQLERLSAEMFESWTGNGAEAAKLKMVAVVADRRAQADQLRRSADAFTAGDNSLVSCQSTAREIVALADGAGHALDVAIRAVQITMDTMTGAGVVNWAVEKATTGVDLEAEGRALLLAAVRPFFEQALGLLDRMEAAIRTYEAVLRTQAEVLRSMPGIVRTDAGPIDLPGDADLRRGALFESVYGHPLPFLGVLPKPRRSRRDASVAAARGRRDEGAGQ